MSHDNTPAVRAVCKSCHQEHEGRYCSNCGQSLTTTKITIGSVLHEIFHLFTHLDHGILYTLKILVRKPGQMQKDYLQGDRIRHQKPFAMYFMSATILSLGLYWINSAVVNYFHGGSAQEVAFFNKYMVILLVVMVPISALITYVLYFKSGYGYAEMIVMQLYTISMILLIVLLIQPIKFLSPDFDTRPIELPVIIAYSIITFYNLFDYQKKWIIVVKAILASIIFFVIVTQIQDLIVEEYIK